MYFSAEEGGLLGSQAIAKSYEDKGKKVKAMLQVRMILGWVSLTDILADGYDGVGQERNHRERWDHPGLCRSRPDRLHCQARGTVS